MSQLPEPSNLLRHGSGIALRPTLQDLLTEKLFKRFGWDWTMLIERE
jgi:hypothetical protein